MNNQIVVVFLRAKLDCLILVEFPRIIALPFLWNSWNKEFIVYSRANTVKNRICV